MQHGCSNGYKAQKGSMHNTSAPKVHEINSSLSLSRGLFISKVNFYVFVVQPYFRFLLKAKTPVILLEITKSRNHMIPQSPAGEERLSEILKASTSLIHELCDMIVQYLVFDLFFIFHLLELPFSFFF